MRALAPSIFLILLSLPVGAQSERSWQTYRAPVGGYSIELPVGSFEVQAQPAQSALTLKEVGGDALLEVYSGTNPDGLTSNGFADFLSRAQRIEEVTYRKIGRSWFVLSGFYRRDAAESQDLIFYAKFMFSADRSRFAAFEISYPAAEKKRFDAVVERLEASFRGPG